MIIKLIIDRLKRESDPQYRPITQFAINGNLNRLRSNFYRQTHFLFKTNRKRIVNSHARTHHGFNL